MTTGCSLLPLTIHVLPQQTSTSSQPKITNYDKAKVFPYIDCSTIYPLGITLPSDVVCVDVGEKFVCVGDEKVRLFERVMLHI